MVTTPHALHIPAGDPAGPVDRIDYGNGNYSTAKGRERAAAILASMPTFPAHHHPQHTSHILTVRLNSTHPHQPHVAMYDAARFHGHMGTQPMPAAATQQFDRLNETTVTQMPRSHRRETLRSRLATVIFHGGYRGRRAAR